MKNLKQATYNKIQQYQEFIEEKVHLEYINPNSKYGKYDSSFKEKILDEQEK